MAPSPRFRISFFCVLTALLVLGGCRPGSQWENSRLSRVVSSIQPAGGDYDVRPPEKKGEAVKKEEEALSPLEQHMRARKMVDPNDMSSSHAYTYRYDPKTGHLVKAFATVEGISKDGMKRVLGMRKPHLMSEAELKLVSLQGESKAVKPSKTEKKLVKESEKVVVPARSAQMAALEEYSEKSGESIYSAPSGKHAVVTGVRRGEHEDKTRLVLDLTDSVSFDYLMDEDKNVLAVTLPDVDWQADVRHVYENHPLLLAYLAKPLSSSGGTLLAVKMKKDAKLVFKSLYSPNSTRGYRLVFDVAAR